jgi:hypothetical protein
MRIERLSRRGIVVTMTVIDRRSGTGRIRDVE